MYRHNDAYGYEFQDILIRYAPEERVHYTARCLGIMRPCLLRQLIHQAPMPTDQLNLTVNTLLATQCTEFATHSLKWEYPMPNPDLLTRMVYYDMAWEGFATDEPWSGCARQRIHYFFDTEYALRLAEAEANF